MGLTYRFVPPGTELQPPGEEGEVPEGLVFASSWNSGTGPTDNAVRDINRIVPWTSVAFSDFTVVANSGGNAIPGIPTANYLLFGDSPPGGNTMELKITGRLTAPAVGESIFLRKYIFFTGGSASGDMHGSYFENAGGTSGWGPTTLGLYIPQGGFGASDVDFYISAGSTQDPNNERYFWPGFAIPKNLGYRIEIRYTRVGISTYTLAGRLYDEDGILVAAEEDWVCVPGQGGVDNFPLEDMVFNVTGGGAAAMVEYHTGLESAQSINGNFGGEAAVTLQQTTNANAWPGPWVSAEDTWEP